MPRPIEFDRDQALREAMTEFWRRGYRGTSVKDLVAATSLQPGSLYGAFESKRALFREALEAYFSATLERVRGTLHGPAPPLARIRRFFETLVEDAARDRDMKGCLLVNTLLEVPPEDEQIRRRVAEMFAQIEERLRGVLDQARTRGELAEDKDPAALARLLVTGIYGLRVYNRTRPGEAALKEIVDSLLRAVEA
ncbi:MAG: TetR family transcriptional regulator [Gammaproteobacteria bacterium]|nr:TetR family transcriptional regulator [Gammaproteobacteria bacterium]